MGYSAGYQQWRLAHNELNEFLVLPWSLLVASSSTLGLSWVQGGPEGGTNLNRAVCAAWLSGGTVRMDEYASSEVRKRSCRTTVRHGQARQQRAMADRQVDCYHCSHGRSEPFAVLIGCNACKATADAFAG